jgi:hypothetical protein
VARAAEPDGWFDTLGDDASATTTSDDAARRRIGELEQRVNELEAELRAQASAKSSELAAAHARNHALAARNHALSAENQELVQLGAVAPAPASAGGQMCLDGDPKERLRYWAKQIRNGQTSYRRLSSDWNAAVNVLLRNERQLDPSNPWREL